MMRVKNSIQTKLTICILAVSLLPALLLFLLTLHNNSQFYKQQITNASEVTIEKQAMTINNIFSNVEKMLDTMLYNGITSENDIQLIAKSELGGAPPSQYQRLMNSRKVISIGESFVYNNDYIEAVLLYIPDKHLYSYNKSYKTELGMEDFAEQNKWFVNSKNPYVSIQIINPGKLSGSDKYIIISKNVSDLQNGKVIGMLSIVINTGMLKNINSGSLPWDSICVMDSAGKVLFGDDSIFFREDVLKQILSSNMGHITKGGSNDIFLYSTLNVNNWKIVSQVSMESYDRVFMHNVTYLIIIMFLCIIGVLFLLYVLSRIFTRPVINLSRIMLNTMPDTASIHSKYLRRDDEIGILYKRFGEMIEKMNALIQDKYLNEIALLKSKMKNLVAQINSHFVFNTLENINGLAEIEEIENISVMSKSLGDMLRYSIDCEEDIVPLKSEIEQIGKYIGIQEIRFGKKIHYQVNMEKEMLEHPVLKFMLQPIVENAIEHGLLARENEWQLVISAKAQNSRLRVTVRDNGIGIQESKLIQVRETIASGEIREKAEGRHHDIGLANINKRIRLLFGADFGLNIESGPDGTRVYADLPL
jgi:sensor histidine kinase YesM